MPIYSAFSMPHYGGSAMPSSALEILKDAREILKDRLYYTSLAYHPHQYPDVHFFSIDQILVYINFYSDFGPNNLAQVFRFCEMLVEKMKSPSLYQKKICLYSGMEADKRANSAFLISAYMVIVHKKHPEEAYQPLIGISPPFVAYRDAGYGPATYHITVLDTLKGLYKALTIGLIDVENFDVDEYEFYERVENGDMNWISRKFLALANPKEEAPPQVLRAMSMNRYTTNGTLSKFYSVYRINELTQRFQETGIKTIVRLNNKTYDRGKFLAAGIEHIEMYFPDGTTPPDAILLKFLELCETRAGPIAVHCKAGLGRTGTLIASYLMKHYRMTASEVIAYLRIVRPGSVVGPQQNFLQSIQEKIWSLHPAVKLPANISCMTPSTYFSSTRFGVPTGPVFNPPRSLAMPPSSTKSNAADFITSSSEDDDMDFVSTNETVKRAPSATVVSPIRTDFYAQSYQQHQISSASSTPSPMSVTKTSTSSDFSMDTYSIPIQPRKHVSSVKTSQAAPVETGRFVSTLASEMNAARITADQLRPMSSFGFTPSSSSSSAANRYNLRSQTGSETKEDKSKPQFTISGMGVFNGADQDLKPAPNSVKPQSAKESSRVRNHQ